MSVEIRVPTTAQEWEDYYDLRYRVLREPLNQPRGSERNEGDATGQHFALYDQKRLVAIARLDESDPLTAQVRFVAVDTALQGKGYGLKIMQAVEEAARLSGHKQMILHARDYAVDFYLRQGYRLLEKSHLLYGVLQHYLMDKQL